jgi:hypothetical protein
MTGSLRERDAALDLLQGAEQAEPRDEFGIASLRDVLANAFFPGVTTLQTRAKYFLWVPAVYVELERRRPRGGRVRDAIRRHEEDLMMGLRANRLGLGDGVIGSRSWRLPQRSATGIYWHGTRSLNLRAFNNPQRGYHRWLASASRAKPDSLAEEEAEPQNWHSWFYEQKSLLQDHRVALSDDQGAFLAGRIETIRDSPRRCLLKDLLDLELPHEVPFWDVEKVRRGRTALSDLAMHAGYLSAAMDGAIRAYGVLWARMREDLDTEAFQAHFADWATSHSSAYWKEWDLDDFWTEVTALPRGDLAKSRTRTFVNPLIAEYKRRSTPQLSQALRSHLVNRERLVKPGRARLSGSVTVQDRAPALDGSLNFRWWRARRMLEDVRQRGGR